MLTTVYDDVRLELLTLRRLCTQAPSHMRGRTQWTRRGEHEEDRSALHYFVGQRRSPTSRSLAAPRRHETPDMGTK